MADFLTPRKAEGDAQISPAHAGPSWPGHSDAGTRCPHAIRPSRPGGCGAHIPAGSLASEPWKINGVVGTLTPALQPAIPVLEQDAQKYKPVIFSHSLCCLQGFIFTPRSCCSSFAFCMSPRHSVGAHQADLLGPRQHQTNIPMRLPQQERKVSRDAW